MKKYYVYILKCSDSSYYTGVTNNLERRLAEHKVETNSKAYMYKRSPFELMFAEEFEDIKQAIEFEKQIKGWSRKKKEAIIENNWGRLKSEARCLNETTHLNNGG